VAWRSLARLLMRRGAPGDRDQALRALELAARESPRDEGIALDRADILLESKDAADLAQARQVLETFLKRAPRAPIVSSRLASLDAQLGRHAAARDRLHALLETLVAGDPHRPWLEAEWALYAWLAADPRPPAPPGTDVGQDGVDAEAAALRLDMIVELQPEDGALLLARARVDLKRDRPDVARVWLEAAALAGPSRVTSDALLLQQVATSLQRTRMPEAPPLRTFFGPDVSLRKAQRLVGLLPWLVAAHETLARVLEREGDYEQAERTYLAARERTADPAERARLDAAAAHAREEAQRRDRNRDM
jgi:tetratricopeptide (TPR) repeat protein